MSDPALQVEKFLVAHNIADGRMVVAVSGGADSVALLRILSQVAEQFHLELIVGHFDHQLRDCSANDAEWVREIAKQLNLPAVIGSPPVDEVSSGSGIEETARNRRYDFLQKLAIEHQASWIAVAHTAEDQAETILHHIARGTGLSGLAGIPLIRELTKEITLIRPLLRVRRHQLLEVLQAWEQDYLTDETNISRAFTRNRIRHDVLPMLREQINPQVDDALIRLGEQARDAQSAIDKIALDLLSLVVTGRIQEEVRIARDPLQQIPRPIVVSLLIQLWKEQSWPRKQMTQFHWRLLSEMIITGSPPKLVLPQGLQATVRRNALEIRKNS